MHSFKAGKEKFWHDRSGFTLIELVVVIAIISIFFMIATPRLTKLFSTQRQNFAIFTGMAAKTFDDSFLNNRTNYFTVHLKNMDPEDSQGQKDVFNQRNGISVLNIVNGEFVESDRKSLKFKEFSDSFLIEEVIKPSGEKITNGNVLIPYYPHGYSDNVIIHVLVNEEQQWSIRIDKHIKEPKVIEGYIGYEAE